MKPIEVISKPQASETKPIQKAKPQFVLNRKQRRALEKSKRKRGR